MDLKIEWSEPYKVKVNTIDNWRRTWLIPDDALNAFFAFWREEKFTLLKQGFSVRKEEDSWFLSETKLSKIQFLDIGITRKLEAPQLSDFMLPDHDIKDESGLRPWQTVAAGRLVSAIRKWNCAVDGSDLGVGKCHPKGTLIRMYDGSLKMVENVKVGDKLMGDDSTPRTVMSLGDGIGDLYNVHPYKGGEVFGVNGEHILVLVNTKTKEKLEISVRDYIFKCTSSTRFHGEWKLFRASVEYDKRPVPLDPYFLGLWVGDGTWCYTCVTVADIDVEIADFINNFASSMGLRVHVSSPKKDANGVDAKCKNYAVRGVKHGMNPLLSLMRSMGIMVKEKFIPDIYIYNIREIRLQTLAGLIDSDGSMYHSGCYEFSCKYDSLKNQVIELGRSLGYCVNAIKVDRTYTYLGKKYSNKYWRINISGAHDLPCKLRRKFSKPRKQIKNVLHTSFGLEPIGIGKYFGFTLDGNSRYLMKDFTVTHNTYTACAVARDMGMKIAVVCPKAVISSWEEVIRNHFKMGDSLIEVTNYEQLKFGHSKLAKLTIPRTKRKKVLQWNVPKNTLIIWDESQKLKNWTTKNAKSCLNAHRQGFKQLFCSATNATNPTELRTVGTCLRLFKGGPTNWFQWLKEHGCDNSGAYGSVVFTDDEDLRKKVLKKLNKDIFLDRGVRLRRDTIPNFPQCDLFAVLLDMDKQDVNKINTIYDEMERELKQLEILKKLDKRSQMVVELRHRQQIELVKVPLFIDMIEEAKEGGFSVVVFVNFTNTINALAERLGTKCVFDGKTPDDIRELNKKRFQNNEEQVILVNVQSGGSGLSLHDLYGGHPRMSLISPSYSPVDMRQVVGRVWRDDAKTKAIQKLVCVSHTVEENVYRNVTKKLNNLDLLNDGDLAYAKNYEVIHN
jgi:hypothetical protein